VRVHPIEARPKDSIDTDLPSVTVHVGVSAHPECVRCWLHRHDVGSNAEHPDLCGRCVENVVGRGETRRFT
jgi:isoleucyl-tRNA synthetase